ncbi:MAG: glycosyltransferase family 2 protein [Elusimicrobiota bacterium]
MNLSIIVTHHHTPELLDLCLKSIQGTLKNIKHRIIVVDSESDHKVQELIPEKYPDTQLISFKKNIGYAKIVNAGLKKAKGDFILILNADIIVLEGAIQKMLEYIKRRPEVGIVAPQLIDFTNNIQNSCFSNPTLKAIIARRTFFRKTKWGTKAMNNFIVPGSQVRKPTKVDWVQGSALMANKQAIEKVGLLDEHFFMYFEDADWCRRFWQKGYEVIYLPAAKMVHYYHRNSKKWGGFIDIFLNKYTRIHIISALKYFWKYQKSNKYEA